MHLYDCWNPWGCTVMESTGSVVMKCPFIIGNTDQGIQTAQQYVLRLLSMRTVHK